LPIYQRSEPDGPLRQGEITTGLRRVVLILEALAGGALSVDLETFPYAVLINQDCDLAQDHGTRARGGGATGLPNLLFLLAVPIDQFHEALPPGSDIWKRIIQNKDERYHVLERIPTDCDALGEGLPALGLDFKQCITLRTDEVLFRYKERSAQRRSRLTTPWAEHLSSRFAYYYSRVALPQDHDLTS